MDSADPLHEGETFSRQDYKESAFYGLEFVDCRFENCRFNGTLFEKCRFEDCVFSDCDLSLIKPKYSSFIDVDFKDSKLVGVNWYQAALPISANFYSSSLDFSSFVGLNLTNIKMTECLAREVDFMDANLTGGHFSATDFSDSRFVNVTLTRADFRQALNYAIDPNKNFLKKTRFSLPEAMSLLAGLDILID